MTEFKNERGAGLGAAALAKLFTEARTHNAFLGRPVPDALLVEAVDLAKMGPTAANAQPLRVLFLRSQEAKERLRPALSPGNLDKTMSRAGRGASPAYDLEFYEHLPFCFRTRTRRSWFAGNSAFAERTAFQSGTLQVGYLILALEGARPRRRPDGRLRQRQGRRRILSRRQDEVQRSDQHRLRRRRQAVPAQSALRLRPDGESALSLLTDRLETVKCRKSACSLLFVLRPYRGAG